MNSNSVAELANAKSNLESTTELNQRFLDFALIRSSPAGIATKLEVLDQKLVISGFGRTAEATARAVRLPGTDFAMEYAFLVKDGESNVEVWRFYLTPVGQVAETLDDPASICDFNNDYIAKHICGRVLLGILQSPLFAPSPRAAY
jgi:hypothetical protein